MRTVIGKRLVEISAEALAERRRGYAKVLVDVGTGDGRFAYRWAHDHPDTFCIGLDPVAEAMREMSWKSARKPARGGLPNVMYVVASIEDPPSDLTQIADRLFVNYPWGSLLRAFVVPDDRLLRCVMSLGRPGTPVTVLLNASVFEDSSYMERLGLPPFDLEAVEARLKPSLKRIGVEILDSSCPAGELPYPTRWERRLVAGSKRRTMRIEALMHETVETE